MWWHYPIQGVLAHRERYAVCVFYHQSSEAPFKGQLVVLSILGENSVILVSVSNLMEEEKCPLPRGVSSDHGIDYSHWRHIV